MRYIAAIVGDDVDLYGKGGLPSVAAARRWITDAFTSDSDATEGAIYQDVPAHRACGDELGCDGHLVEEVRR